LTTNQVEVALSTFNGSLYVQELLESIWGQDYPSVLLSVRDDGSTDDTVPRVQAFLERARASSGATKARFQGGPNVGPKMSFMALLMAADPESSYFAFCDQDDVWLADKLSSAVKALRSIVGPALYCSAVTLASEDLTPIKVYRRCVRGPSFENALVENIATGCTIVMNKSALALLQSREPSNLIMHDAWCYLVVAGHGGTVLYDPKPHVLYRLHSSNAVGVQRTSRAEWARRAARHFAAGGEHALMAQAKELEMLYGDRLTAAARRELRSFIAGQATLCARLKYAWAGAAHRQRAQDDIVFRALYVLGRI